MLRSIPPQPAGINASIVLTATLLGMALGGWLTGEVFDPTGFCRAAFVKGVLWNLLNLPIVRSRPGRKRKGWRLCRPIQTTDPTAVRR